MGKKSHKDAANSADDVLKKLFNDFIAAVKNATKPVATIIHDGDRWLGFIADARSGTPFYYVFTTDAPDDSHKNQQQALACLLAIRYLSSGRINESNVLYGGFPMQLHTPKASGALVCWMMERMAERMNVEPQRSINDLLEDCFSEWRTVTLDREDLQKEFVEDLRAKMRASLEEHRKTEACSP